MEQSEVELLMDAFMSEVCYRKHPMDCPWPRHKKICEGVINYVRYLQCCNQYLTQQNKKLKEAIK